MKKDNKNNIEITFGRVECEKNVQKIRMPEVD